MNKVVAGVERGDWKGFRKRTGRRGGGGQDFVYVFWDGGLRRHFNFEVCGIEF